MLYDYCDLPQGNVHQGETMIMLNINRVLNWVAVKLVTYLQTNHKRYYVKKVGNNYLYLYGKVFSMEMGHPDSVKEITDQNEIARMFDEPVNVKHHHFM